MNRIIALPPSYRRRVLCNHYVTHKLIGTELYYSLSHPKYQWVEGLCNSGVLTRISDPPPIPLGGCCATMILNVI